MGPPPTPPIPLYGIVTLLYPYMKRLNASPSYTHSSPPYTPSSSLLQLPLYRIATLTPNEVAAFQIWSAPYDVTYRVTGWLAWRQCSHTILELETTNANKQDSHNTAKSFRNLIKSNRNPIVFIIFRLIWYQTDVRLVPNQSENCNYKLISVWLNKISKRFLCVYALRETAALRMMYFHFLSN